MVPILDACYGSRMFWFNKNNPNVIFMDKRSEQHTLCDGRTLNVSPDIIGDFTNMPFADKSFKLVVFDPPHLIHIGESSWMAKKYGKLPQDWQTTIKRGFDECMRCLDDYGTLVFKWNTRDIAIKDIIEVIGQEPLFGHATKNGGFTIWMAFMKFPKMKNYGQMS